MLRHATGFYLANAGQDTRAIQLYLGHKNIQHTVRYTELASGRFRDAGRTDIGIESFTNHLSLSNVRRDGASRFYPSPAGRRSIAPGSPRNGNLRTEAGD